jgi:hypothetical protein
MGLFYLLSIYGKLCTGTSRQIHSILGQSIQSGLVPSRMWTLLFLCWCVVYASAMTLSMREVDGLVFTEEEINLDRLEKHVFVWKLDLEGGRGGSSPLEVMLAERLMRESALLMRTLLSYVPAEDKETPPKAVSPPRGGVGVASITYCFFLYFSHQ